MGQAENIGRKKVLVTGATSGIGRATALRFAEEGFDVCLMDVQDTGLVKKSLKAGHHLVLRGSFAEEQAVAQCGALLEKEWGRLDALVSCAGFSRTTGFLDTPLVEWENITHTLIRGAFLTSRLATNLMKAGGRIIHITSIHGRRAEYGSGGYAMAKAAIDQLCRNMAVELASHHILVNAIAPGFVDTAMSVGADGVSELKTNWFRENYVDGHHLPLRRAAQPEEIAGVAWFLAGKDASYLTGQVLTVDGGLTITF